MYACAYPCPPSLIAALSLLLVCKHHALRQGGFVVIIAEAWCLSAALHAAEAQNIY